MMYGLGPLTSRPVTTKVSLSFLLGSLKCLRLLSCFRIAFKKGIGTVLEVESEIFSAISLFAFLGLTFVNIKTYEFVQDVHRFSIKINYFEGRKPPRRLRLEAETNFY